MTLFDSRAAGTSEAEWAQGWLSGLPELAPPARDDRLLVVAAHPDDETLGAGGLLATAAALGIAVTVVIATDGEASHPNSLTHSPGELAEIRRAEVTAALARLHPQADLRFLGWPDSKLAAHTDELARSLAPFAELASVIVTPWSGDRHPDHEACAEAGARLARAVGIEHWQFPIWAWHWASLQSAELPRARLRRLRLDDAAVQAKRGAMAAHVSQHTALSAGPGDEAILSASMLAHFRRDYEVFVISDPAPATRAEYFDDLYAQQRDPWGLIDRFYERRKRDLVLASLPREHFRRAFEPGCAIGALTTRLAERCDEVVAWDGATAAVEQAISRTANQRDAGRVQVQCARIPHDWPAGRFDLIVLSEVGYYCLDQPQLRDRIEASLTTDGILLACHWRHLAPDHPVTAQRVHESLGHGRRRIVAHHEDDFLLDVWTRDGASVALTEGLLG